MPSRAQRRARQKIKKTSEELVEKRKHSPLLYAGSVLVLVLIILAFIVGPALSGGGGSVGRLVFGSYDGREIEYIPGSYFARQREAIADRAAEAGDTDDIASLQYQIWLDAFTETVRHTAILIEAERSGLWVSKDRIDGALITYPPYTENGVFSEERYGKAPASEQHATRELFREQLTQDQYLSDVLLSQLTPAAEQEFITEMVRVERSFTVVAFPYADFPIDAVLAYGEENAPRFTRTKLSRILIKAGEREAQDVLARLDSNATSFEELAKAHSKDGFAAEGGSMGWQYYHEIEGEFDTTDSVDLIYALRQGQYTDVLESRFGWVIYRCEEDPILIDLGLDDDKAVVREYMSRYEGGRIEDYTLSIAEDFASRAREADLVKTALADQITIWTTSFFPINYQSVFFLKPVQVTGGPSGFLRSAAYNEEFFSAAFSLERDEVSDPILLDDEIVVLQLAAERDIPDTDMEIMDDYHAYVAEQARSADLQNALLDQNKLESTFNETYATYIAPR